MSVNFYISLRNPNRSYFTGQRVEGEVIFRNDKPLKAKEIIIDLDGISKVSWSKQEHYTVPVTETQNGAHVTRHQTQTRNVTISAHEDLASLRIVLAGDGVNFTEFPVGVLTFPFSFLLERNLPSSFTSKTGVVKYELKAEVKRPFLTVNKRASIPFTVNGLYDLNLEHGARLPQQCRDVKGSNFCACRQGQISFLLQIPRSGFVPGQIICFRAEVTNGSNQKVIGMKAAISQLCTFYAQGLKKYEEKIVAEVQGPEVEEGEYEVWERADLMVPPVPPSKLGGVSRLIDVQYFLEMEVTISGLSSALKGKIPIIIGNIPLQEAFREFQQAPAPQPQVMPYPTAPPPGFMVGPGSSQAQPVLGKGEMASGPSGMAPSALPFPAYPDMPPPTYAEAVAAEGYAGHRDALEGMPENGDFIPKYATFYS